MRSCLTAKPLRPIQTLAVGVVGDRRCLCDFWAMLTLLVRPTCQFCVMKKIRTMFGAFSSQSAGSPRIFRLMHYTSVFGTTYAIGFISFRTRSSAGCELGIVGRQRQDTENTWFLQ